MSNFPLYDCLKKDIGPEMLTQDLTSKQQNEFLILVKKINNNEYNKEILYILICIHNQQTIKEYTRTPFLGFIKNERKNKNVQQNAPNKNSVLSTLSFNLDNFPVDLKQILYNFLLKTKKK